MCLYVVHRIRNNDETFAFQLMLLAQVAEMEKVSVQHDSILDVLHRSSHQVSARSNLNQVSSLASKCLAWLLLTGCNVNEKPTLLALTRFVANQRGHARSHYSLGTLSLQKNDCYSKASTAASDERTLSSKPVALRRSTDGFDEDNLVAHLGRALRWLSIPAISNARCADTRNSLWTTRST